MLKNSIKAFALLIIGNSLLSPANSQTPGFTSTDYKKALWMTTRMYGGQRAGNNNWLLYDHPLSANGNSFVKDSDGGYSLTGGWFDCGDHVKFGQTEFYTAYVLLKAYSEFPAGYDDRYAYDYAGYRKAANWSFEGTGHAPNGIPDILDEVKHATDYFIKVTRDASTFYYQIGDGAADHQNWVTSVKMSTFSQAQGGESDKPRNIFTNFADGALPAYAGATLALMGRVYKSIDPDYAKICLDHAEIAYHYAKNKKGQEAGAPGGFYGANVNAMNAYAMLLTELYWATKTETYKTEAMALSISRDAATSDVQANAYGMDYANNGDLAIYNLFLLGKTGAAKIFTDIVNIHYLANVQADGQFAGGNVGYGPLRYNASAALIASLWAKRNSPTDAVKKFIFSNIDYILGKNNSSYSFVVGFGSKGAGRPHHRNVYMSDVNPSNKDVLVIPEKNKQFGYMVGGRRNPSDYIPNDKTDSYQYTEGGIDYNSSLVGALGYINSLVAPVSKFSVEEIPTPIVTGIEDDLEFETLVVYPNPSSTQFGINAPENTYVKVFDELGRIVKEFNTTDQILFGSELPSGIYHISFYRGNFLVKSTNLIKN